jgi:predicted nucleic acid-binding protein
MIVTDASATISALLNDGPARRLLADEQLHAPHLLDPEVASGMRRRVLARDITADQGWAALDVLRRLAVTRYPAAALLDRIWELRDDVSAHDATYVALAEALECPLVTADARLGRAPGARCPVTIVPR